MVYITVTYILCRTKTTNVFKKVRPQEKHSLTRKSRSYSYVRTRILIILITTYFGKRAATPVIKDAQLSSTLTILFKRQKLHILSVILVSTGVNDIDNYNVIQVFNKITHIIHNLTIKFPGIKIIISEITPRCDDRDCEVIICNKMLNSFVDTKENIFIARHSNLRDETFSMFRDIKHIQKTKIAKFASNLKIALRKAYGVKSTRFSRKEEYTGIKNHLQSRTLLQNHTPLQSHMLDTGLNDIHQHNTDINNRLFSIANVNNPRNQERDNAGNGMDTNQNLKSKIVEAFTTSLNLIFNG